jgi:IS30 family transposase
MNKPYTRLTLAEREEISRGIYAYEKTSVIAERIGRPQSAVSREIGLNVKSRWCYHAIPANETAEDRRVTQRRKKKLDDNKQLKEYVYEKLTKAQWSPEEIARRIKLEYPKDTTMRISRETIYQHLYCLPRGELKKELMRNLRQERKFRQPRADLYAKRQRIQDIISIAERPKEVEGRIVPGHWEGDLVMGSKASNSAIGTLVERTTRLTLLVPLKTKDAISVATAFAKAFESIPAEFKKTLTYDRGSEMASHKLFTKESKIKVFFADPYSPWQRGTNENTNGLIRQYFPKGTDFKMIHPAKLKSIERRLNSRPRKALSFYTPSERFYELTTGQKIALGT